eukprot:1322042-Rhodomonas_salina.1
MCGTGLAYGAACAVLSQRMRACCAADYDGRTALHLAACEGHVPVARDLRCSVLTQRAWEGSKVKFLLEKKANVDVTDRFGGTPIQVSQLWRRLKKEKATYHMRGTPCAKKVFDLGMYQHTSRERLPGLVAGTDGAVPGRCTALAERGTNAAVPAQWAAGKGGHGLRRKTL